MEDLQYCPVCLEIPVAEICQCENGHTVCGSYSANLTTCTQSREPYGSRKMRNRVLEQRLDAQKFDCIHKDDGCNEKLKRQDISSHGENCQFNKSVRKLCKELGFDDCNLRLNPSSPSMIIKHFEEHHGVVTKHWNQIILLHAEFTSVIKTNVTKQSFMWTPTIMSLNNEDDVSQGLFLIRGWVDNRRDSVHWGCIQIYSAEKVTTLCTDYEAEFGLCKMTTKKDITARKNMTPRLRWTVPVVDLKMLEYPQLFQPIEIPIMYISAICLNPDMDGSDLAVSVFIQNMDNPVERPSSTRLPEVWISGSEMHPPNNNVEGDGVRESLFGTTCDKCKTNEPIIGNMYGCLQCFDYGECEACFREGTHSEHIFAFLRNSQQASLFQKYFTRIRSHGNPPIAQGSMNTIFHDVECDGCYKKPIFRKQYKCLQCDEYNLCEDCVEQGTHSSHVFAVLTTQQKSKLLMASFNQIRF